jgi:hypothetical protein
MNMPFFKFGTVHFKMKYFLGQETTKKQYRARIVPRLGSILIKGSSLLVKAFNYTYTITNISPPLRALGDTFSDGFRFGAYAHAYLLANNNF